MDPILANSVQPGATIGIAAPASPYTLYSDVLRGIAWWEAQGFKVRLAQGALERTYWTAGNPQQRARDLEALFLDPQIAAVQCLRGGVGSAEIIPYLDFELLAAHPRPFIGFSDITALHCAFSRLAGLVTFYGPSLTTLGDPQVSSLTTGRMLSVLGGETTGPLPSNPQDPFLLPIAAGKASGRLVGGCLSDVMHTLGTPWEIDLNGAIFAFEEVGSSPHHIDRDLLQLTQAGKFVGLRGVAIGSLADCEWNEGGGSPFPHTKTLEEVLQDRLAVLGIPVVYGFPFGHGGEIVTLPLGVQATLDAATGSLVIDQPALK
jgi:muramoyltetrapeptide carboxypeptidase